MTEGIDNDTRLDPQIAAEMSFVGSCILWGSLDKLAPYRKLLYKDAYKSSQVGLVAHSIGMMLDKNQAVDLVTLAHFMQAHKEGIRTWLEMVGGEDYLVAVAEEVPSRANIEHYAAIVEERWRRRRILDSARSLAETAKNPEATISEVIAAATSVSGEAASMMPKSVFVHISEIDVSKDELSGVPTGFDGLDSQITTHGYPLGQMTVIRAYHKGGKSSTLIQSALSAARAGKKVLYATFADLHRKHIKRRMMRMLTGYQYPPEGESLFGDWGAELKRLDALALDVYDVAETDDGGSVEEFVAWAQSQAKIGGPWDVVFVDYAQELTSSSRKVWGKMEEQMECARVLNRFAAQSKCAVVVGSQITTDLSGGVKTKWGRDWEEKAGWVLTIVPPKPELPYNYEITISYSRFGQQYPRSTNVPIFFNTNLLCFEEAYV